jgi:hypothetical protein
MNVIELTSTRPDPGPRPPAPAILHLPPGGLERTQEELRARSDGQREALVLWAGRPRPGGGAGLTHLLALDCNASRHRLDVPIAERIKVAEHVRSERLLVFADLHTHPGDAFLSEADRVRPFGVRDGFYAIVVPTFAEGVPGAGWAMFEADGGRWWEGSTDERFRTQ